MKKFLNDPSDVVREALEGAVLLQPGTALLDERLIVVQRSRLVTEENRSSVPVAVLSGGGSGHEPAHAGYVAPGMLTAAVAGAVFASPSVDAVLDGIRAVCGDAGCLLVVKSYTGDRLNFTLAAELARAEGLEVAVVVVGDDAALEDDQDANAGRRGLAGTVLVHKVAGATAEAGGSLTEVAEVARRVASQVATIGVGLTGASVPGAEEAGFDLAEDEVEIGLGIHGEQGVRREKLRPADALVQDLVEALIADRGLTAGDEVALLVGNAGGTPVLELNVVTRAAVNALQQAGLVVRRVWAGSVMTSIDMQGISVSVLEVSADLLDLLDAPTRSLAWPGGTAAGVSEPRAEVHRAPVPAAPTEDGGDSGEADQAVREAIDRACRALLDAEAELTRMDQEVGDGDLGEALARGARAWLDDPVDGSASTLLRTVSARCRRAIGGTSGPLYAIGLLRAAEALHEGADWPTAFAAGVDGVSQLGGARPGDRTMLDALVPAAEASPEGLSAAVSAAERGVESTRELRARRGRSSYLGDRVHGHPDPGAAAVVVWLSALG